MTEYVILPGADYGAACDAVRQKTGKAEGIRSGELAAEILSIAPKLQELTVNPGVRDVTATPMEGYDGFSSVTVTAPKLQGKTVSPSSEGEQVIRADAGYYALSRVTVEAVNLQEKTVIPGRQIQTVEPDALYDGLSAVTVSGMILQDQHVSPGTEEQVIVPETGYDGLSEVTVAAIKLQDKTVTPGAEVQEIFPDEGYDGMGKVTVKAATANDALRTLTVKNSRTQKLTVYYAVAGSDAVQTLELSSGGQTEIQIPAGGLVALRSTHARSATTSSGSYTMSYTGSNVSAQLIDDRYNQSSVYYYRYTLLVGLVDAEQNAEIEVKY